MNIDLTNNPDFDFSTQNGNVADLESFLDAEFGVGGETTNEVDDELITPSTEEEEVKEETSPATEEGEELTIPTEPVNPPKEEKPEPNIVSSESSNKYKNILDTLMKSKVIEAFDTIETEDGEIPLSEYDLDEESFAGIIQAQIENARSEGEKNTTKNVSDFTKHLIEIEKNGGNVSQALETYNMYQDPLDNLDLSIELDQQKAVFMKYHQLKGMDKETTMDLIESFMNKGKLEEEALKADAEIRGAIDKQMEALNNQAVAQKEEKKKQLKLYRDSLSENLNKFDLNSNVKKKIVDYATKENENGSFELDTLYYNLRNNPETASELALFLIDKDTYKKQVAKEEVRDTQIKTMKSLKVVKRGSDSINITPKNPGKTHTGNVIDLSDFE